MCLKQLSRLTMGISTALCRLRCQAICANLSCKHVAVQVGQLLRNSTDQAIALGQVILQDAKWHMVTLTTLWDGTPGYAMMIDGQLAAVLNGNYTYTGACLPHFIATGQHVCQLL